MARKQLARLSDLGMEMKSACEMEFYLLDKETQSKGAAKRPSFSTSTGHAALEKFMYTLDDFLNQAGVDVETLQEEFGSSTRPLLL